MNKIYPLDMMPIMDTQTLEEELTDQYVDEFLRFLEESDDVQCEIIHNTEVVCSVKVTHKIMACTGSRNMCENATTFKRWMLANMADWQCYDCKRHIDQCWKIVAI